MRQDGTAAERHRERDVDTVEPVSADIRRVGAQVRAEHHTVGVVRTLPGDVNQLDCACGVVLTNGPGWSLDEHLRLHRAEVKYEALLAVAHPGMPLSRTAGHAPAALALEALLDGDTDVARTALAGLDAGTRAALGSAALHLARLLGASPDPAPAEGDRPEAGSGTEPPAAPATARRAD
jgi:hypothetical protein